MPPFLEDLIDRMCSRGIFTSKTRPDSCIINFYSEGAHITHVAHVTFVCDIASVTSVTSVTSIVTYVTHARHLRCITNFYSSGDCIPPHIDHLDFTRPFVTLSLLSEQVPRV